MASPMHGHLRWESCAYQRAGTTGEQRNETEVCGEVAVYEQLLQKRQSKDQCHCTRGKRGASRALRQVCDQAGAKRSLSVMNTRRTIRNTWARVPAPWGAALGIGALVAVGLLIARLAPPLRDSEKESRECAKQYGPRFGQLVRDMDGPMSAKWQYRQVCKCQ